MDCDSGPDEHLPRDQSLPWPAGSPLDTAYRAGIRERLAAGRTLVQAELEAFVDVAPAIAAADCPPLSDAFAPPGPDELLPPSSRL